VTPLPKRTSYTPERVASDDYAQHVRDIDADTPGRFNADPKRLFEASGSAGKVMIFAVRLDTFPEEGETKVFYIGTNDPAELTKSAGIFLSISKICRLKVSTCTVSPSISRKNTGRSETLPTQQNQLVAG
jgi:hypothetical protein